MSFAGAIVEQRKLILTTVALLAGLGAVSWLTMNRQEDPRLPDYFGQVQVVFPGADAETVERLVLEPIEEHLAEVDEILHTDGGQDPVLRVQHIAAGIEGHHVTVAGIAGIVAVGHCPQGIPGADVRPAGIQGNDQAFARFFRQRFHHRIVDRFRR